MRQSCKQCFIMQSVLQLFLAARGIISSSLWVEEDSGILFLRLWKDNWVIFKMLFLRFFFFLKSPCIITVKNRSIFKKYRVFSFFLGETKIKTAKCLSRGMAFVLLFLDQAGLIFWQFLKMFFPTSLFSFWVRKKWDLCGKWAKVSM